MLRRLPPAALIFALSACACAQAPSPRECEAAVDNIIRVEVAESAHGRGVSAVAGAFAVVAARLDGRYERAIARCETQWNRSVTNCLRVAATAAEFAKCKPHAWSDPITIPR